MSTETYMTKNAEALIEIVSKEYLLQHQRAIGGHISEAQIIPCLRERLIAIGKRNESLRAFLLDVGPIPEADDTAKDREWAEDPREDSHHEVRTSTCEPNRSDEMEEFPLAGERIC